MERSMDPLKTQEGTDYWKEVNLQTARSVGAACEVPSTLVVIEAHEPNYSASIWRSIPPQQGSPELQAAAMRALLRERCAVASLWIFEANTRVIVRDGLPEDGEALVALYEDVRFGRELWMASITGKPPERTVAAFEKIDLEAGSILGDVHNLLLGKEMT